LVVGAKNYGRKKITTGTKALGFTEVVFVILRELCALVVLGLIETLSVCSRCCEELGKKDAEICAAKEV